MKKTMFLILSTMICLQVLMFAKVQAIEGDCDDEVLCSEEVSDEVELPILYIKGVNPGYEIDGVLNVGEMIEIRKNSDSPFLLAGTTVGYTNSSGNYSVLFEFPENSWMTGEVILLRLASSPSSELAAENYTKTLAYKGGLTIEIEGEIVDELCWLGVEGCYKGFSSDNPTTLVRNDETGLFEHLVDYEPVYSEDAYQIINESEEDDGSEDGEDEGDEENGGGESDEDGDGKDGDEGNIDEAGDEEDLEQCEGLHISELLSYYDEAKEEQFIEFYNANENEVDLSKCKLRYKNKIYELKGMIQNHSYYIYKPDGFVLTKNPTKFNTVEIIDEIGRVISKVDYPNGQKKNTSYAWSGYDEEGVEVWEITYEPTPGEKNVIKKHKDCDEGKEFDESTQKCVEKKEEVEKTCKEGYYLNPETNRCKKIEVEYEKTCKEGYYLNEETGRCRKVVVEEEKVCKEGYYLNPETNRCKKIATTEVKTCKEGYYINPETNRCKKIEVEEEKTCKEGYYLNEETGRCKKIKENTGAEYEIVPEEYEEKSSFVGLYAVVGVVGVGIIYLIYEYRKEIGKFVRKVFRRK